MRSSRIMTAITLIVLATLFLQSGSRTVTALTMRSAPSGKKVCKIVTKRVHGTKKHVRVCRSVKPKSTPAPVPTPTAIPPDDRPTDMVVDSQGQLYVQHGGIITKYSADGTPLASSASNILPGGQRCSPWGMALSPEGNIYVADDCQPTTITTFSPALQPIHTYKDTTGAAYDLLALDGQGNIYAPSGTTPTLDRISADVSRSVEIHKFDQHDDIWGVATEPDGHILVSIISQATIVRLAADGTEIKRSSLKPMYQEVDALAVDSHGFVYVTAGTGGQFADEVIKLSPDLKEVGVIAPRGAAPGQVDTPLGMKVDSHDNLYVADFGNHRIDKFSPSGTLLATVATRFP